MERQKYNRLILETLSKLIEKHPDLRFGQILVNSDIIELVPDYNNTALVALDPFNEESEIVWNRMKDNKFAFKELFN
jgi:hypothetical protein